jgi:UPF0755 protein
MKKLLSLLVIFALTFVSWNLWYGRALRAPDAGNEERVIVRIQKGASTADIAETLEEKGIIRSKAAFVRYAKKSGKAHALQAGSFVLLKSMDVPAVIDALTSGTSQEAPVTVPEGYTAMDIDALLAEKGIIAPGELMACVQSCDFSDVSFLPTAAGLAERGGRLEGYLYPDTYFVVLDDFDPEAFLRRMLSTFRQKVVVELEGGIASSDRTLHEVVTMASLIEKETRTDDERPVVSGILWKRYDAQMGLGVDATVRYILEKPTAALTTADLNANSPYNLRKFRGLPPGPIASPGIASIRAALKPQESDYWYYLHGKDGQVRYAVTNEEHNLNKYKYLR